MRQPSIHITLDTFRDILEELEITNFPISHFFQKASLKAINSRVIQVSNKQITKQVNKVLLADKGDATMVADILYSVRIKLKHRGVRKINPNNTKDWTNCKQLAEILNNFCQDFGYELRDGYIKYIEYGISRMSNNRNILQRLISMSENIWASWESMQEIDSDPNKSLTRSIHDYYVGQIASRTGITEDYSNQPDKYIYFFKLKEFLDKHGWKYEDYIDAQFEALAFCNGIPSPDTFLMDKSLERYNKWLYKNANNPQQTTPKIKGSLWERINQH